MFQCSNCHVNPSKCYELQIGFGLSIGRCEICKERAVCADCQCDAHSLSKKITSTDPAVVQKQMDGIEEFVQALGLTGSAAEATRDFTKKRIDEIAAKKADELMERVRIDQALQEEKDEEAAEKERQLGIKDTLSGIKDDLRGLLARVEELEDRL